MNIGIFSENRSKVVSVFTWLWLLGSLIASAYFSFHLFPKILDMRNSVLVPVWFQAQSSAGNFYYPNTKYYRKEFISILSDTKFLYFSACNVLPLSQRPLCDIAKNWQKIAPEDIGCTDVQSCMVESYRIPAEKRYLFISGIQPVEETSITLADEAAISFSDPVSWGDAAELPLFFIVLFLALKLGRALGEFLFLPYEK